MQNEWIYRVTYGPAIWRRVIYLPAVSTHLPGATAPAETCYVSVLTPYRSSGFRNPLTLTMSNFWELHMLIILTKGKKGTFLCNVEIYLKKTLN